MKNIYEFKSEEVTREAHVSAMLMNEPRLPNAGLRAADYMWLQDGQPARALIFEQPINGTMNIGGWTCR